jgi:hypothetical protein
MTPTKLPALQLWTPPQVDEAIWARILAVIEGHRRDLVRRAEVGGGPAVGVLLRLPGASDPQIAAWWARLVDGVGTRHGAGAHLALGLRLDGEIDAARLIALGLARRPCDWLHLAARASSIAQTRAAWNQLAAFAAADGVGRSARYPPVSRAAHDATTLAEALADGADAMTLSPVCATASKPSVEPLGWPEFARLAARAPGRVWALGGMRPGDLTQAQTFGGAGVALLSAAWSSAAPVSPEHAADAEASP